MVKSFLTGVFNIAGVKGRNQNLYFLSYTQVFS